MLGPRKRYLAKTYICGETGNETGILWLLAVQNKGNRSQNPQQLQTYLSWVEEPRYVETGRSSTGFTARKDTAAIVFLLIKTPTEVLQVSDSEVRCEHSVPHFRLYLPHAASPATKMHLLLLLQF